MTTTCHYHLSKHKLKFNRECVAGSVIQGIGDSGILGWLEEGTNQFQTPLVMRAHPKGDGTQMTLKPKSPSFRIYISKHQT